MVCEQSFGYCRAAMNCWNRMASAASTAADGIVSFRRRRRAKTPRAAPRRGNRWRDTRERAARQIPQASPTRWSAPKFSHPPPSARRAARVGNRTDTTRLRVTLHLVCIRPDRLFALFSAFCAGRLLMHPSARPTVNASPPSHWSSFPSALITQSPHSNAQPLADKVGQLLCSTLAMPPERVR